MSPTHHDLVLFDEADLIYAVVSRCDREIPKIIAIIDNYRKEACDEVWTITKDRVTFPPSC